jgi:glycosyltransferase involved in cell wall biosynthesis
MDLQAQARPIISVVVPMYNEAAVIGETHRRLIAAMATLGVTWEVIYVNDGSTDTTLAIIDALRQTDRRLALLNLSRNFGKEIATTAGLDHARGDAVIVMDADLQDPPEVIPKLVAAWHNGYDTVYAQRRRRDGDTRLKKATAAVFYRLMRNVGDVPLPQNVGDFRLMSRRVVDALQQLRERHRFMKGLFAWVGFPTTVVVYDREARGAGRTKWSLWKLWNLALEGITSFTVAPLKLATYLGLAVAVFAVAFGAQLIVRTLLFGNPVAGYPSLMAVVLFLGGTQLLTLGIIGEYLGRVFNETKRRPLYFVERYSPSRDGGDGDADHVALADDRGELLLGPGLGAGGAQREHHPAIIGG